MCYSPLFVRGTYVPCGKCYECLIQKSNEWAYRVCLEAKDKPACMITLTYNEESLPDGQAVSKAELQKFIKRLRKKISPCAIKYFGCGEYGKKFSRPHYHVVIIGWKPDDLLYFYTDNKHTPLYRSQTIETLWKKGFSSVGELNLKTARYAVKYLQKNPPHKQKPFTLMSKGIGYANFNDDWLVSDKIYIDGKYIKIPRYFLTKAEQKGIDLTVFKERRKARFNSEYLSNDTCVTAFNDCKRIFDTPALIADCSRRKKKFEKIFKNS